MDFIIRKDIYGNWWHDYNNDATKVNISDFEAVIDDVENTFIIQCFNGSNVPSRAISIVDIKVIDQNISDTPIPFSGAVGLKNLLTTKSYPPYRDSSIVYDEKVIFRKGHTVLWNETQEYFNTNFDSTGKGILLADGWALCNGNNGTKDFRDRFILNKGNNYNTLYTNGGSANSVLIGHNHDSIEYSDGKKAVNTLGSGASVLGKAIPESSATAQTNKTSVKGQSNTGVDSPTEDGVGKNMPPYIIAQWVERTEDLIVYYTGSEGGGGIESIVAGTNISVDNTDPLNPIISATGSAGVPTLQEVLLEGGRELVLYSENDTYVLEYADKSRLLYCRKTTEDYTVVQFGIQGGVFESGDTIEFISSNIDSFELNVDVDLSGVILIYQGEEYGGGNILSFADKGIKLILTCIDTNTFELNIIPTYEAILDRSAINASSSFTAVNSRYYTTYGGTPITVTDPAGVSGKGYIVYVVSGLTTIGGVEYAASDLIYRYYNGTIWTSINMRESGGVPYTGATADVNLGEFGLLTGNIEFDNTPTNIPTGPGSMVWNDTDGTVDLKLKGGNVTLQIGQESVLRVVNKTATNINLLEANYQAVRVTGAQGQRLKVDLAQATSDTLSAETIGLVTETINSNQEGFITTSGLIRNVNTTGSLQSETWSDGDILYLSPTVAGQITKVKPVAPNHLVIIGYVVHAHATQGSIFVKVDNGYELDELHNVKIASATNNELLAYTSSTDIWENKSITSILGYTPIKKIVSDTTSSSAVTGTTSETLCKTYTISENTFSDGDFMKCLVGLEKTGTAGTGTVRIRVNQTNNFATATLVGTYTPSAASHVTVLFKRDFLSFKSGVLKGILFATSAQNDLASGASIAYNTTTLSPTSDFYIYISVINTSGADSTIVNQVQITN